MWNQHRNFTVISIGFQLLINYDSNQTGLSPDSERSSGRNKHSISKRNCKISKIFGHQINVIMNTLPH